MAVNVGAMLLVFLALIALINGLFSSLGEFVGLNSWIIENTPYESLSLEFILGYLFAPLMWLIGVASEDISLMGQLLGVKLAANEFVGYTQLASLMDATNAIHFKYQKSVACNPTMACFHNRHRTVFMVSFRPLCLRLPCRPLRCRITICIVFVFDFTAVGWAFAFFGLAHTHAAGAQPPQIEMSANKCMARTGPPHPDC